MVNKFLHSIETTEEQAKEIIQQAKEEAKKIKEQAQDEIKTASESHAQNLKDLADAKMQQVIQEEEKRDISFQEETEAEIVALEAKARDQEHDVVEHLVKSLFA